MSLFLMGVCLISLKFMLCYVICSSWDEAISGFGFHITISVVDHSVSQSPANSFFDVAVACIVENVRISIMSVVLQFQTYWHFWYRRPY